MIFTCRISEDFLFL